MSDAVRQHDEVARGVEEPAGTEQLPGEGLRQEVAPRAACAMEHQHGIGRPSPVVADRPAQRAVVQLQLGEGFARSEAEIAQDEVPFDRLGKGGARRGRSQTAGSEGENEKAPDQVAQPHGPSTTRARRMKSSRGNSRAR